MSVKPSVHIESSYDGANIVSKVLFCWMTRFFISSQKKRLKVSDLEICPKYSQSEAIGVKLESEWVKQLSNCKKGKRPSLGWAIIRAIGPRYSVAFILIVIQNLFPFAQTLFMGALVDNLYTLSKPDIDVQATKNRIYLYALAVVVAQICGAYSNNFYWFYARKGGIDTRVACSRLIYHKTLKLSQKALGETTTGQIVNLLSNDVARFDYASEFPFFFVFGPMQVALYLWILWPKLGISAVIGFFVIFLFAPFQTFMGKAFGNIRAKGAFRTDERIRLMNEFIPAMRVIKMYAWEKPFAAMVDQARREEINKIRAAAYLRSINMGVGTVSEKLIMFLVLCSYVLLGNHLSAQTVFVAMSLIRQLQYTVTFFIPLGISYGAESLISIKRIQKFLELPEIDKSDIDRVDHKQGTFIDYRNVQIRWKDDQDPVLDGINFRAEKGKLMTIVGPVGSGKSTLLISLMDEVTPTLGQINVNGKISYACQQAWIFAGTVKDNILFGHEFESTRYKKVISVAALERDMQILPAGDQTVVGDRGTSLSGGQRARINLARALYAKADIYLLDDPLSAVDAPVAKHIFEKSIKEFLGEKIVILVTHQLQFMKSADTILLLRNGKQVCCGDYIEFLKKGADFLESTTITTTEKEPQPSPSIEPTISRQLSKRLSRQPSLSSIVTSVSIAGTETEIVDEFTLPELPEEGEATEISGLKSKGSPLWTYIRSGINPCVLPFWIFYVIGAQLLISFIEYYFSLWTDSEERKGTAATSNGNVTLESISFVDNFSEKDNVIFFASLTVVLLVWCLTRNIAFFYVLMKASIKLHDRLFRAIVRAPISFFDNNPPGVILNRISRDMGMVDDFLPTTLFDTVVILASNLASIILMAVINGYLVLPAFFLFIVAALARKYYVDIARDVKRLEGVTKSPVFSHLSASVSGLTTIRAFKAQERFKKSFDLYQDEHTSAYFTWIASSRFFITVIYHIANTYTTAIIAILLIVLDSLNGSKAGLVITSAISLAAGINWGMRQLTEVETMMTSVERVDELSYVEPEAALESSPPSKPADSWPSKGEVAFHHVCLKYDETKPPVLDDINFTIEDKEKVGIVGRTGAGKSSIMTALYRMTEPEGHIIIDGVDVSSIGLHELRKKISIIPQEPVIFSGSVRYNLDPFSTKTDVELWEALTQVQLKRAVDEMGGLDAIVTDGGTNLSVGQRQLVCLARAILANNRILVLDEATANIDPSTDELIQQTIRKRFSDCTVLTIAHRLHTIMDSDKILVMDAGKVAQFGPPASLVEDKEGIFYSMVQATGKETSEALIKIAMRQRLRVKELNDDS